MSREKAKQTPKQVLCRVELESPRPSPSTISLRLAASIRRVKVQRGSAFASAVVGAASGAGRILLTLDKGIANLQRYPARQHAGVVLFRPGTSGTSAVIGFVRERLKKILEQDLKGRRTDVGPFRIQVR